MKYPLLRYERLLLESNTKPMCVKGLLSIVTLLQARSDEAALEDMKISMMRDALIRAAGEERTKPAWELSNRMDGLHVYAEFYILTRDQLAMLLDGAYLLGKMDNGPRTMV